MSGSATPGTATPIDRIYMISVRPPAYSASAAPLEEEEYLPPKYGDLYPDYSTVPLTDAPPPSAGRGRQQSSRNKCNWKWGKPLGIGLVLIVIALAVMIGIIFIYRGSNATSGPGRGPEKVVFLTDCRPPRGVDIVVSTCWINSTSLAVIAKSVANPPTKTFLFLVTLYQSNTECNFVMLDHGNFEDDIACTVEKEIFVKVTSHPRISIYTVRNSWISLNYWEPVQFGTSSKIAVNTISALVQEGRWLYVYTKREQDNILDNVIAVDGFELSHINNKTSALVMNPGKVKTLNINTDKPAAVIYPRSFPFLHAQFTSDGYIITFESNRKALYLYSEMGEFIRSLEVDEYDLKRVKQFSLTQAFKDRTYMATTEDFWTPESIKIYHIV